MLVSALFCPSLPAFAFCVSFFSLQIFLQVLIPSEMFVSLLRVPLTYASAHRRPYQVWPPNLAFQVEFVHPQFVGLGRIDQRRHLLLSLLVGTRRNSVHFVFPLTHKGSQL